MNQPMSLCINKSREAVWMANNLCCAFVPQAILRWGLLNPELRTPTKRKLRLAEFITNMVHVSTPWFHVYHSQLPASSIGRTPQIILWIGLFKHRRPVAIINWCISMVLREQPTALFTLHVNSISFVMFCGQNLNLK